MKLGNLAARFATAAVAAPILILAINWDRHEGWWSIVIVATALALIEFFQMTLDEPAERWFGVGLGLAIAVLLYWTDYGIWLALPLAVVAPALLYLIRLPSDLDSTMARAGTMTFGVVYIGVLLTFIALSKKHGGYSWVYITLFVAWFADTLAYFSGRFLGKRKLYPAVSPNKTWAGAVGGLAGSFLAAVVANLWFFPELGWVHGAIVTLVGGLLGQSGDLIESLLKRARNVKDSGNLLPGHGGLLDRIDAVLLIAPWVYLYSQLVWS